MQMVLTDEYAHKIGKMIEGELSSREQKCDWQTRRHENYITAILCRIEVLLLL